MMKQIKWLMNSLIWGLLAAGFPVSFTAMALSSAPGGRLSGGTAYAGESPHPERRLQAGRAGDPAGRDTWGQACAADTVDTAALVAGVGAAAAMRRDTFPLPASRYGLTDGRESLFLPSGEEEGPDDSDDGRRGDQLQAGDADARTLPGGAGKGSGRHSCLASFFRGLDALAAGRDTVLTVVHLGDSHIQAGHYSGRAMRLLQARFGNAGRGWIAPFKLSRTNEPDDYFISSVVKDWVAGRCIQATPKTPLGPGGIGLKTLSPSVNLDVAIAPVNGAGYSFNQAVLYRGDRSMPLLPAGPLKESVRTFRADSVCAPGLLADTFRIARLTDTLQLHSTRRQPGTDRLLPASSFQSVYYGLSLTNGRPGILYHSVGVNGAMFVNYTDEAFVRRLAALRPSLLIISLGTNETFGRHFRSEEFAGQAEAFLRLVRRHMPDACLLLTTPAECYKRVYVAKKRTYVRNENTARAARALMQVARKEGIACWDLFTATGGANSCRKWQAAGLMGRDRVHFSKEGYQEQGLLLYRALMHAYQAEEREPLSAETAGKAGRQPLPCGTSGKTGEGAVPPNTAGTAGKGFLPGETAGAAGNESNRKEK